MSIHSVVLHFMLAANTNKPVTGNYLSIGKQSVLIDEVRISRLLQIYGYPPVNRLEIDDKTRKTLFGVQDVDLLRAFSAANYDCLDKSDYESANEILDLNSVNIPHTLQQNFDFIYDGGTLDNVFSPAQAIANLAKMLRVGGRILNFNLGTGWPGVYCAASCEWLFSFYAANQFANVKVFMAIPVVADRKWPDPAFSIFSYSPYFTINPKYDPFEASTRASPVGGFVIGFAERTANSTVDKIPTQSHYLEAGEMDWRKKFMEYEQSQHLALKFDMDSNNEMALCPFESDHYKYLGVLS
jgi:hypothetical protein